MSAPHRRHAASYYCLSCLLFFVHATAPTEIYTLSLHDALPISRGAPVVARQPRALRDDRAAAGDQAAGSRHGPRRRRDRKSTRLNSSHVEISYAVFCLKKKKKNTQIAEHKGHKAQSKCRRDAID